MKNINRISPLKSDYLKLLETIDKCPTSLSYIGTLPETRQKSVAIVGSRKVTSYGKEVAYRLAYDLAAKGVVIVSGLAIGVDAIAHRAALDAGGTTVAVLGNGLPAIYPSSHKQLAGDIIDKGGLIVSEYGSGAPALPHQFLERNRIVSGLSNIVVIIEAAARSGTLSTAAHALSQGRDVMAVPGNITNPTSAGCNMLIKQGAGVVTSTSDVLISLGISETVEQAVRHFSGTPEEIIIQRLIEKGVRDGSELLVLSKLSPGTFNQHLSMLEITGRIRALGANQWSL